MWLVRRTWCEAAGGLSTATRGMVAYDTQFDQTGFDGEASYKSSAANTNMHI